MPNHKIRIFVFSSKKGSNSFFSNLGKILNNHLAANFKRYLGYVTRYLVNKGKDSNVESEGFHNDMTEMEWCSNAVVSHFCALSFICSAV